MAELSPDSFTSDLSQPSERFLSKLLQHAFEDGWKTPDDFLTDFPPKDIISALEGADELRVALLVAATGVHEKIARKKSIDSAAEDLQLALDEDMVKAKDLLNELPYDERVRYLEPSRLWEFLTAGDFFDATPGDGKRFERAVSRVAFTLEVALAEDLLSLQDIADGIGFESLSKSLPLHVLQKLVRQALESGRSGTAFDEEQLLSIIPLKDLISHIDLSDTWTQVVLEKVADPADFLDADGARPKKVVKPDAPASPPNGTAKGGMASTPPPKKGAGKGPKSKQKAEPVSPASPSSAPAGSPEDEEAREAVAAELRELKRLPPNYKDIPLAALCSIESMYADLAGVEDDDERIEVVEESFPNESMMRVAMLGLIRLLDPSVDVEDPVIKDAEMGSLVKIVMFEEKRRRAAGEGGAPELPEMDLEVEELPS